MITPGFETTQLSSSNSVRRAALGAGLQGKYGAVARIAREFRISNSALQKNHWDERTQRNPLLLFLLSGSFLLRFDARRFSGLLLFQEPPRKTGSDDPSATPILSRSCGFGTLFSALGPASQQTADLIEHGCQVLILIEGQQLQVLGQAIVQPQIGQRTVGRGQGC